MPYNTFTLERVRADFGVTIATVPNLFAHIPPRPVDPAVQTILTRFRGLAVTINTEKARAEMLVAPLLGEVWRVGAGRVALYSGVRFDVDPAAELNGVCDYILGRPPQLDYVSQPVMMIAEAKNEYMMGGLGQCAAEMVAAQRFNARYNGDTATVYGCVTDGGEWRFLRLTGTLLEIDLDDYLVPEADRILGIILHCVGLTPASPAAA